ncbi:MAG: iron-containing alcohol dehydrogenase, partial [Clostridia bacterium]
MNIFKKAYCRIFQKIAYVASPFLKWKMPIVLTLDNGIADLPSKINELGIAKILIVSGSTTKKLGLLDPLILNLKAQNVLFEWYDHVAPNPTFEMIYEAEQLYRDGACEAIVAFGGGSPMDCAKIVGARIAKPKQSIDKMRGLLKIRKTLPPLFAIPTTAGSGSETTLASVVTNSKTHTKFAISDPVLIPKYVALDPTLTAGLPPDLTATTGMDALTHAVEAYIGHSNIKLTRRNAEVAVKE